MQPHPSTNVPGGTIVSPFLEAEDCSYGGGEIAWRVSNVVLIVDQPKLVLRGVAKNVESRDLIAELLTLLQSLDGSMTR